MNRVFLSLGSNIDPERNMPRAVRRLAKRCHLLAVSPVYETDPVGVQRGPRFLNAAALIETELDPRLLKDQVLLVIEDDLGRRRTQNKNAPRTIDIDIALYNDQILQVGPRHVPDPDILEHAHIAVPLADLAPDMRHPETGQTLLEISRSLSATGIQHRPDIELSPNKTTH